MDDVPVFVAQQVFCDDAAFKLRRQAPFRADHVVTRQVPPEIVVLFLLAAIHLIAAEDFECLAIHDEDAGWSVGAIFATASQGGHIDAFRAAMDRVRA